MRTLAPTGPKASASGAGVPPTFPRQNDNLDGRPTSETGILVTPFGHAQKLLRGFSLVEVTLALGIITFGLIAVMSLLPTGLRLAKQSADEVAAVNIMTGISVSLEKAGSAASSGNATFNADGMRIPKTADPAYVAMHATYAARWDIRSNSVPRTALITVSWPATTINSLGSVESIIVMSQPPR